MGRGKKISDVERLEMAEYLYKKSKTPEALTNKRFTPRSVKFWNRMAKKCDRPPRSLLEHYRNKMKGRLHLIHGLQQKKALRVMQHFRSQFSSLKERDLLINQCTSYEITFSRANTISNYDRLNDGSTSEPLITWVKPRRGECSSSSSSEDETEGEEEEDSSGESSDGRTQQSHKATGQQQQQKNTKGVLAPISQPGPSTSAAAAASGHGRQRASQAVHVPFSPSSPSTSAPARASGRASRDAAPASRLRQTIVDLSSDSEAEAPPSKKTPEVVLRSLIRSTAKSPDLRGDRAIPRRGQDDQALADEDEAGATRADLAAGKPQRALGAAAGADAAITKRGETGSNDAAAAHHPAERCGACNRTFPCNKDALSGDENMEDEEESGAARSRTRRISSADGTMNRAFLHPATLVKCEEEQEHGHSNFRTNAAAAAASAESSSSAAAAAARLPQAMLDYDTIPARKRRAAAAASLEIVEDGNGRQERDQHRHGNRSPPAKRGQTHHQHQIQHQFQQPRREGRPPAASSSAAAAAAAAASSEEDVKPALHGRRLAAAAARSVEVIDIDDEGEGLTGGARTRSPPTISALSPLATTGPGQLERAAELARHGPDAHRTKVHHGQYRAHAGDGEAKTRNGARVVPAHIKRIDANDKPAGVARAQREEPEDEAFYAVFSAHVGSTMRTREELNRLGSSLTTRDEVDESVAQKYIAMLKRAIKEQRAALESAKND